MSQTSTVTAKPESGRVVVDRDGLLDLIQSWADVRAKAIRYEVPFADADRAWADILGALDGETT